MEAVDPGNSHSYCRGTENLVQILRVGGGRCTVAPELVRPAYAVKQVQSLSQLPADTLTLRPCEGFRPMWAL